MDVNPLRLAFAAAHFAIAHAVCADDELLRQVEAITGGDLSAVVFDATGNARSMMDAFHYVAHGGRLVFVRLIDADITFSDPFFHRREPDVAGHMQLDRARLSTHPGLDRRGPGGHDGLGHTHRAPAEAMSETFEHWPNPQSGMVKAMVEF